MMQSPAQNRELERLKRIEAAAKKLVPFIEKDVAFESFFATEHDPKYGIPKYGVFVTPHDWKALVDAVKEK